MRACYTAALAAPALSSAGTGVPFITSPVCVLSRASSGPASVASPVSCVCIQGKHDGALTLEADGLCVCDLAPGDEVRVAQADAPVPFFLPHSVAADQVWLNDVMHMLQWNRGRARAPQPEL